MVPSTASNTGWGRRLIGVSAVGAVTVAVILAGAPGAFAANDYLEFSRDGRTYDSSVSGPLFEEGIQYVPGSAVETTIWIRNNSVEAAWLSSAAVMVRSDPQLNGQLGLTAGGQTAPSDRAVLGAQGSCSDIPQVWALDPGEELELSLEADLSWSAPNNTMNRTADFDVIFLLGSKEAAPRAACGALSTGAVPSPAGSGANPSESPTQGREQSIALAAVPGTGAGTSSASNNVRPAGMSESASTARLPKGVTSLEQQMPVEILPAGVFSTVEPIIRSLPGTLLIAMSVTFALALVLRFRKRHV